MQYDDRESAFNALVLAITLAWGGICLLGFLMYWCCCRVRRIPGVVLTSPNSEDAHAALISPQNAPMASNFVVMPGQNTMGAVPTNHGASCPVMPINPHVGHQYPAMCFSGTDSVYHGVRPLDAPPTYNQSFQQHQQQPLHKPPMQY